MSVVIYRQGDTHTVNGVRCELKIVNHEFFTGQPEPGWFFSPEEAYKEIDHGVQKEEIEEPKAEEVKKVTAKKKTSNDKVRLAAKKAGIEDFDKARIETLKEKLKNAK
ncbi:MAG: hypothetical protein GY746_10960 [Gammaproteobacteria bacterium]|nr:hypothetical protein [Gammaproteobacteria bacterium]